MLRQVRVRAGWAVVVAVGVVVAAACGDGGRLGRPPTAFPAGVELLGETTECRGGEGASGGDRVAAVSAVNEFGLELYRAVASGGMDEVAVSPSSVLAGLGMVYAGARGGTAAELARVLHLDLPAADAHDAIAALTDELTSRARDGLEIRVANAVWGQRDVTFLRSFVDTLAGRYCAPLATVDLHGDPDGNRERINQWVANVTRDRITDLFPDGTIQPATKLVLANALSLDAKWKHPFDPSQTRDEPFHLSTGEIVDVPTMHYDLFLPSGHSEEWGSAVELPYAGDDLSMVVVVPRDLAAFETSLDKDLLTTVFDSIKDKGIHLALPRFVLSAHRSLVDPLKTLGLRSLFADGNPDFSGMTGSPALFLAAVEHEVFVKVDEKGTEAAAATGGAMASHGPTVTVDRPFLFMIRDRPTGALLFVGRVMDPR